MEDPGCLWKHKEEVGNIYIHLIGLSDRRSKQEVPAVYKKPKSHRLLLKNKQLLFILSVRIEQNIFIYLALFPEEITKCIHDPILFFSKVFFLSQVIQVMNWPISCSFWGRGLNVSNIYGDLACPPLVIWHMRINLHVSRSVSSSLPQGHGFVWVQYMTFVLQNNNKKRLKNLLFFLFAIKQVTMKKNIFAD